MVSCNAVRLPVRVFEIIVHNRRAFCYVGYCRRTESKARVPGECQWRLEDKALHQWKHSQGLPLQHDGGLIRGVCRTRLAVFYQSLREGIHRVCRLLLYCTDFSYRSPTFLKVSRLFLYCTDFSYSSPTFLKVSRLFSKCAAFSYSVPPFLIKCLYL
jgi:hypothetical protein